MVAAGHSAATVLAPVHLSCGFSLVEAAADELFQRMPSQAHLGLFLTASVVRVVACVQLVPGSC